jgi:hypothetical protein
MKTIASVLGLLIACGSSEPKEKGRASECFGYTAPAGWTLAPSKTKADLVLKNPQTFPISASKTMQDGFSVAFLPFAGSLDAFKEQLVAAMTQQNLDVAISEQQKANQDVPKLKSGVPTPTITTMKLGGRDAMRVDVRNPITLDDATVVTMVMTSVFAKFGDEIVDVSAGYVDTREAIVKPIQTAFLASLNFDRCK